jgi:hypothetical protein
VVQRCEILLAETVKRVILLRAFKFMVAAVSSVGAASQSDWQKYAKLIARRFFV